MSLAPHGQQSDMLRGSNPFSTEEASDGEGDTHTTSEHDQQSQYTQQLNRNPYNNSAESNGAGVGAEVGSEKVVNPFNDNFVDVEMTVVQDIGLQEANSSYGLRPSHSTHAIDVNDVENINETIQAMDEQQKELREYYYNTQEPRPNTIYYRQDGSRNTGQNRPKLDDIFNKGGVDDTTDESTSAAQQEEMFEVKQLDTTGAIKFGWVKGVLVRCLLNIWGVMLFIRLSWVVGQAGIGLASCVILLSTVVTIITTVSMSAICTNGEVKGGGAYYLISRSLGPEFGGAIGLIFSFANAVGIALYVVGFAETVFEIMNNNDATWFGKQADVRIIGIITITLLLGIAMIGTSWEAKIQLVLLTVLSGGIVVFMIGSFAGPDALQRDQGFVGYSTSVFSDNFGPHWQGETFFSVFSIFFPAATGILAGANMSGDLKDAQKAIPKGTFLAIGISTTVYLVMAWVCGFCVLRQVIDTRASADANSTVYSTEYGLLYSYDVVAMVSIWSPLVYAGIFSATLSSALVSLVSAPRIFQAVCKDKLFPYTSYFAVGMGPGDDPMRGYFLAYGIGLIFVLMGELNTIAPVLSNFFLMSYALINYSCFALSMSKSPAWRPAFKYYNKWLSLIGALLCLAIMFIINWVAALISIAIIFVVYKYIEWAKPDANWGSAAQAAQYMKALDNMLELEITIEHVKTFRPQLLVMQGDMSQRYELLRLASYFSQRYGLLLATNIITGLDFEENGIKYLDDVKSRELALLDRKKLKVFLDVFLAGTLREGLRQSLQIGGMGKMRPNTVMFGFKHDWIRDMQEVPEYVGMIEDCLTSKMGVIVARGTRDNEHMDTIFSFFEGKHRPKKTIDVWWLGDDGGLTILIPYLITKSNFWSKCKLRILTVGEGMDMTTERLRMTRLLRKFRISGEVVVVDNQSDNPSPESIEMWQQYGVGMKGELTNRIRRYLRLRELMKEYSDEASLIFMTLPVPRKTEESTVYMAFLDLMSVDLPPTCLIRGNQQSVLTFYS
ncbi:hypothetical protein SARC_02040 [Sphaeroforma arctica JP610]|uniref:Amino acid permease/ SLC12A domain-containing protein n=1 Tax=Sphaeroforma arctica JP610 TaxID=667725 RepID=A0A0L0GA67_9EUKA|nr:hypothetical protein SARC_02040 [Sphaeroforma arctica JP610]KNC85776.1 hypothetical protein SARC_02040 [Sphaeroforma arctica JP610]|eukprot:XP_014159678.1 hypothetical protein SARC_02040 [Sphaeroforma arctica JP610]